MNKIKKIAAYCAANIEDYDERVKIALGKMDRMRCDLSTADYELAEEIEERAAEWAEENGYAVDFLEGIDVDEIVMEG